MVGLGRALSSRGTRCLKQDLGDFWEIFRMGGAHGRSGWSGWGVALSSRGTRCLKQDLGDFWEIFRMGARTGGVDGQDGPWP